MRRLGLHPKKTVPPEKKIEPVVEEKKATRVIVEKVEYVKEFPEIERRTTEPVAPVPKTVEAHTPEKELGLKTAEAKALMTVATRLEAELSAPRSYIAQSVQFAKRGDTQTALNYLGDAIALLRESCVKKLNELLDNIERKIALLEKHGTDMSRERKMVARARECIATRDILESVNIYDNLREMLGLAAKPKETAPGVKPTDEIEILLTAMEKYGMDLRDERERYERYRCTATPSELNKFKTEMMEGLHARIHAEIADLGRILVEKKYAGANVKNLAAILKQATITFKRKQYLDTLKYLRSFRKIAGYTTVSQIQKPVSQIPQQIAEKKEDTIDILKISAGEICFLNTNNPRNAYLAVAEFLKKDRVLIMTTTFPEKLKKVYKLENATFVYLTDSYSVEQRCDIRRLDFEIT
ncbi:MAG: hypothetical protein ACP5JR_01240 [Thermoplasmata archaeon]